MDNLTKILLAEDEAALGQIVKESLETKGFTVYLCPDGAQALDTYYKEEEKLEAGAGGGRGFGMMMNSFSAGKQYKNIETNQILEEREFFGKQFL